MATWNGNANMPPVSTGNPTVPPKVLNGKMMRSARLAVLTVLGIAAGAYAQTAPPSTTAPAATQPVIARQLRINLAWQEALEGADFSPGLIDGVFKRKSLMALREYTDRYFPADP